MPISRAELEAQRNRHLVLSGRVTLRQILVLLAAAPQRCELWWHLVVQRSDGAWGIARIAELYEAARGDSARLDAPIEQLDSIHPARVVEQDSGVARAYRLLRQPPGTALVVLKQGRPAGILAPEVHRAGVLPGRREIGEFEQSAPAQAAQVRRHTDVSYPRQVASGTDRFSAVVRLRVDPSSLDSSSRRLDLSPDLPVQVRLNAPAFEVLDSDWQEIRVLPARDSPPVVFDLRPRDSGRHGVTFDFFQGGHALGTVSAVVEVARAPMASTDAATSLDLQPVSPAIAPPDRTLRITWEEGKLGFTLIAEGGASWQRFKAVELRQDPSTYAQSLFETLESLSRGTHPMTSALTSYHRIELAPDEVRTELETVGQSLWELLPRELRDRYGRERTEWKRGSLLILSDEPYLPWELVWPYGTEGTGWRDEEPWCLTLRLARWLCRDERGEGGWPGAPGRLQIRALACLTPQGSNLPAAEAEREILRKLAQQARLLDLSPPDANLKTVLGLLERGGYDWLHVAAHGSFDVRDPDQRTALWLEGGRRALTPRHLAGMGIASHLRRQRPGFFFNSCDSARLAWSLTGLGGWASRLVNLGAGLFLAPLWIVEDETARRLADLFYQGLERGATVAEALCAARAALPAENPSRLAYSLYGHPNARVEIG